jgi:hypothetical protein
MGLVRYLEECGDRALSLRDASRLMITPPQRRRRWTVIELGISVSSFFRKKN